MKKTLQKRKRLVEKCFLWMIIVFLRETLNIFKIYCNSFAKRSYCEEFKCSEY